MTSLIRLAVAVAALLAVPASAQAAGTISAGPAKVKGGYSVSLTAVDAKKDTLTIVVERGKTSNQQTDILTFTRGVKVTVKGSSARIKGSLGKRGSVDLRLTGVKKSKRKLPKGCTGRTGTTYDGKLTGKLRLRLLDGKWVTIRSIPHGSTSTSSDLTCNGDDRRGGDGEGGDGDGQNDEPRLMLSKTTSASSFTFMATKSELMLTRDVKARKDGKTTVAITSMQRATGKNLLTVAGGGQSATVKSKGAFSGSGAFTATGGAPGFATGPLTGSLSVKLRGVPTIKINGDDAMLMNAR